MRHRQIVRGPRSGGVARRVIREEVFAGSRWYGEGGGNDGEEAAGFESSVRREAKAE